MLKLYLVLFLLCWGSIGEASSESSSAPPTPVDLSICKYSEAEVNLLNKLSERNNQLLERQKRIDEKEKFINSINTNIENKISDLIKLRNEISVLLQEYTKIKGPEILSLAKTYENMKPADAAFILQRLDDQVLLKITSNMESSKLAAVLARMRPEKSKALTTVLSNRQESQNLINNLRCSCLEDLK